MQSNSRLLLFLALPFFAFAFMIAQGVLSGMAPRFALPVQGYDPRDMLYGRYVNLQVHRDLITNMGNECACIKPSASKEKVGYQNAVLYMACTEAAKDTCIAVLDSHNEKHTRALANPVRIYIEETLGADLENILRTQPQRIEVEASLNHDRPVFHQLLLDGKPIKSKIAPDPFDIQSLGR
jgi:GDYXXLXY protein